MKRQILKALRRDNGIVSGEALSRTLGVSRVSVWKHIRKLQECGYPIVSTAKGYCLNGSFDALFPWEFSGREAHVHYFPEATSTMEIAKEMARKGSPHFTIVIAGRQQQGRGRLKRVWLSADGGLYFTMVLRPGVPTALAPRINFLASLVLAQTLRRLYSIDAKVKWPNDILVDGKKISGMLSEMEADSDTATFINIGIGVNVNNDPSNREPGAISLKKIHGKAFSRKALLTDFLDVFETRLESLSLDAVIPEWKRHTLTLGRSVKIVTTRETVEGVAEDVDDNGALLLRLPDGSLKKIVSGDCYL
ncbi:MAG: biotin--[acetyl-CoA-carboxylase] ligase [Desulfobacterales bacterium]|nr:biotin--[acetyl-CoA-carboxylase] ligase [Desulfobacterales bacterium]